MCGGRIGWIHTNANEFEEKKWIIVESGGNNNGCICQEKAHLIDNENICFELHEPQPTCFKEALLAEHKEIKKEHLAYMRKLNAANKATSSRKEEDASDEPSE